MSGSGRGTTRAPSAASDYAPKMPGTDASNAQTLSEWWWVGWVGGCDCTNRYWGARANVKTSSKSGVFPVGTHGTYPKVYYINPSCSCCFLTESLSVPTIFSNLVHAIFQALSSSVFLKQRRSCFLLEWFEIPFPCPSLYLALTTCAMEECNLFPDKIQEIR